MVSLVTVTVAPLTELLMDLFIREIKISLKCIKEVVIVEADATVEYDRQWQEDGLRFRKIGMAQPVLNINTGYSIQHALALHKAIDATTEPYLFITDPDIFFYTAIDQFYLDLMKQHDLNAIGVSHQLATEFCMRFFCCVTNMMVKKADLPPSNWLKGEIFFSNAFVLSDAEPCMPADGYYLAPCYIDKYKDFYPYPEGRHDTGCLLWLWALQQKWKWLAFQAPDCHNYLAQYNRGTVKVKLKHQPLMFHGTSSVMLTHKRDGFLAAYKKFVEGGRLAPAHGIKT